MSRIDTLKGFLADEPGDSFTRYALALEYVKQGQNQEAIREFETVRTTDPGYVATYYQLAKAYEREGQVEDAGRTYREGIARADAAGDTKTRDELAEALEMLAGPE